MDHRILVVDDHPDTAECTCAFLSLFGHTCRAAADGVTGVAEAEQFRPEIALIDIGLPDLSGYDVARVLRRRFGRAIYLVAVTGWSYPDARARSSAAGFDQHVLKPAGRDVFATILARADAAFAAAHL